MQQPYTELNKVHRSKMKTSQKYSARILRHHMTEAGISASELARRMDDVPRQWVHELVHGKGNIGIKTAERLAKVFKDTTIDYWMAVGYYGRQ